MMQSAYRSDGDDRFTKLNTRLRPSQLQAGEIARSDNGRIDVNGTWKVRDGYKNVSGVTLTTTNEVLTVGAGEDAGAWLIADKTITAADYGVTTSGKVTITTSETLSDFPASPQTLVVHVENLTYSNTNPNGNRVVTKTGTNTFEYSLTSTNETYGTGSSPQAISAKLTSDAVVIRGSCHFSDPDDTNEDYIIIADNAQATALKLSDLSKTTIAYPSGETLGQDCDMSQEFDVVVLRQSGQTSWYFDPDDGSTGFGGTPAFVKFSTGAATQHTVYDTTGNTVIASGVATVTETGHGRSVGDKLLVVDSVDYDFIEGTEITIATAPTSDTFTYYVDAPDDAGTTIVYSTKASLGGGYVNPPAAPFGTYWQRRSWLKYNYDSESSPAHRGVEDEIIASDILSHVYDPVVNQFRISGGTADHVVALHGFDDDRLLVFNRNSIHQLKGVSGSLTDVQAIQLTNEIGCVARQSVVSYANQVLFLGDQGVYAVSFMDEYNLRGTELPLSEAVDDIFHNRLNREAADKAVAIYHDNRYWIALPLDGSTVNNYVLIYNFLNSGWESLDYTSASAAGEWGIIGLHPARSGKVNELYAVTTVGGVLRMDNTGLNFDSLISSVASSAVTTYSIPAAFSSRQYQFADLRRKKFNRIRVSMRSEENLATDGTFSFVVEDPDQTVALGDIYTEFENGGLAAGETGTLLKRLGNVRGFAGQLQYTNKYGLPEIQSVQVDAVGSFESTTTVT